MSDHMGWQRERLPSRLSLGDDEVHVWQAELSLAGAPITQLLHTLSPDEHARAARFHFERDRVHFVLARGVLRALLGAYVGAPAEALRFTYSAHGKPALADHPAVSFNVSHSGGVALYAVTHRRAIGVDVEHMRETMQCDVIAEQFFSLAERAALAQLPPAQRPAAFFHCWTRKEAYIKAHGIGLSLPLDQFDVTLAPDAPAQILCTHHDPADAARWTIRSLDLAEDYAAALVVEGHGWHVTCREYMHA